MSMSTLGDPPRSAQIVLSLRDVVKRFGEGDVAVTALSRVSVDIRAGELVALLGPSGSGKSTLLLIAGLLEPATEGEIRVRDRRVHVEQDAEAELRDFRRRNIGFVFQKPNLIPFLTARENVQVALEINDVPAATARQESDELLSFLDVGHRAGSLPRTLSGGEQQRVAVARALANRPLLVLADEPTAALDGNRGRQVVELFRRVCRTRGTAVLMVTHDHRYLNLFDRIFDMDDGRVVEREAHRSAAHA